MTPNEAATVPTEDAIPCDHRSTSGPDFCALPRPILRQSTFPRKRRFRPRGRRSRRSAPSSVRSRFGNRSGPDPTNEVRVQRSHGDVRRANFAASAPADEHTRILFSLMLSNDEVERRGASPESNEGTLSRSSTPTMAHRRRDPRSLEPIVRRYRHTPCLMPTPAPIKRRTPAAPPLAIVYPRWVGANSYRNTVASASIRPTRTQPKAVPKTGGCRLILSRLSLQ